MNIQHNYLRWYRKQSKLTQEDIAFILQVGDHSNISRWEQGQRIPDLQTLLAYQLLFDIPIEVIFEKQRSNLMQQIGERVALRMEFLKTNRPDGKALKRIGFLSVAKDKIHQGSKKPL